MWRARLHYVAYQGALLLPSGLCAAAAFESIPPSRPYARLLSVGVVLLLWLFASLRLRRWYFGDRLKERIRNGHFEEVTRILAPAFEMATSSEARVRIGLLLATCEVELGRPKEALTWLGRIEQERLDGITRSMFLTQKARALASTPHEALPLAEEAVTRSRGGPNEVAALTARGIVFLHAQRTQEAIHDLAEASRLAQESPMIAPSFAASRARALAEAYFAAGDTDRFLQTLREAASYPSHIPAARLAQEELKAWGRGSRPKGHHTTSKPPLSAVTIAQIPPEAEEPS